MLEIKSSSSNSGASFEMLAYEVEQDVEDFEVEPKSPDYFYPNE